MYIFTGIEVSIARPEISHPRSVPHAGENRRPGHVQEVVEVEEVVQEIWEREISIL